VANEVRFSLKVTGEAREQARQFLEVSQVPFKGGVAIDVRDENGPIYKHGGPYYDTAPDRQPADQGITVTADAVTLRGWHRSYDGNPPWALAAAIVLKFPACVVEIDGNDVSNDFYQRAIFNNEGGRAMCVLEDAVAGDHGDEHGAMKVYVKDGKRLDWWGKWPVPLDDQEEAPAP
jgi:hypothetical protein